MAKICQGLRGLSQITLWGELWIGSKLVYTYLKNMKVGLKNLYTENIIKYYYKNENNMKSTTLLL